MCSTAGATSAPHAPTRSSPSCWSCPTCPTSISITIALSDAISRSPTQRATSAFCNASRGKCSSGSVPGALWVLLQSLSKTLFDDRDQPFRGKAPDARSDQPRAHAQDALPARRRRIGTVRRAVRRSLGGPRSLHTDAAVLAELVRGAHCELPGRSALGRGAAASGNE